MIDPDARLCDPSLCEDEVLRSRFYSFCYCRPPFPPIDPCPYETNSPIAVLSPPEGGICFCCCGGPFAGVAVDAGEERDVGEVWVGHMVRVARLPS